MHAVEEYVEQGMLLEPMFQQVKRFLQQHSLFCIVFSHLLINSSLHFPLCFSSSVHALTLYCLKFLALEFLRFFQSFSFLQYSSGIELLLCSTSLCNRQINYFDYYAVQLMLVVYSVHINIYFQHLNTCNSTQVFIGVIHVLPVVACT